MIELTEILKSGPAVSAATVAVVAATIKLVKSLFEFNDEHLQKRQLKKLAFLANECEKGQALYRLVQAARDEEVLRNIFGRTGSPQFVSALTRTYETERFSLSELRISSLYLSVRDGALAVDLGWGAHLLLVVSISLVIVMGLYIAALLFQLFGTPSVSSYVAALVLMIFYFLFAWFVGGDARVVLVARRVRNKLEGSKIADSSKA